MTIRARILSRDVLCVMCAGKGLARLGEEVDHIKPLHKGGTDDESNLQALCVECHKVKSARDLGHAPRVTIGRDGWPI
jgi:5-methylcytosine-specific restriction protein A